MVSRDYIYISAAVLIFILGAVLGCETNKRLNPCNETSVVSDTIVVRDTVRLPVPQPVSKGVVKAEKVKPQIKPIEPVKKSESTEVPEEGKTVINDTPVLTESGEVEIPIERKEYVTKDYRAVVEGWRPSLVSMEVYRETKTITNTVTKRPIFSITVGPGAGYDGTKFVPFVGVTAGLVLWSK